MPGIESLLYVVVYISVLGFFVLGVWWLTKKMKPSPWVNTVVLAILAILVLLFLAHQLGMI